ncbi:MAG: IS1634 family transposase [Gemmatimonadota bacterium]
MYVRRTTRKLADGTRVGYLQLAHKVRDPETGTPRDEVLHHFGREDELDRAQIKRLIRSLTRFLEPEEQAEVEAELAGVGAEVVTVERSLPFGGTYVLDRLWKRLELDEVLGEMLEERDYEIDIERLLFALVANRTLDPRSKLSMERWVGKRAWIEELPEVQVHQLYRAMDFLVNQGEEVQRAVFFSTASLLNLEVDLLFFDTTTTYFEVEEEDELRRYGGASSKDERPDRPQVVVGLAVTRDGLPVRCWVYPGNASDATVVKEIQEDLAGWRLNRVVWVVDSGMGGEDQRVALQRGGGQAIIGEKLHSDEKAVQEALSRGGRYQEVRENLHVKEVTVSEGSQERRLVVLRNPERAERDREKREDALAHLEETLPRLNRQIERAREEAEAEEGKEYSHPPAVCELLSHDFYGKYVREKADHSLAIDRGRVRAEERLDGKSLVSTTDPSLSAAEVATGYKELAEAEAAFRTLKQTLDLRPLYHRTEERITAHVLLCWLGLLLVRLAEKETGESWEKLRDELQQIHRVKVRTEDGTFELVTEPTPTQRNLLSNLEIEAPSKVQDVVPGAQAA